MTGIESHVTCVFARKNDFSLKNTNYKNCAGEVEMFFSLIIGTLNRTDILKVCLDKLEKQIFRDFEVVIVDQSNENSTERFLNKSSYSYYIQYYATKEIGLSNARNIALSKAKGEYFCLIDDDGLYIYII